MRFLPAVVATTLGTVSAFLLPPTISSKDKATIDALSFENAIAADGRILEIDCPRCPVNVKDFLGQVHAVTTQIQSVLRLNFSIAHDGAADQLMLNGLPIYPQEPSLLRSQHILTADQLVKSPDGTWNYAATPELSFSLGIRHPILPDDTQIDLIEILVQVLNVGGKPIDGMKITQLKLLETPSGKLMIGDAQFLLPARPLKPTDDDQECTNVICKWKAIITAKLSGLKLPKLKGCSGSSKHSQAWSGHGKPGHSRHGGRPHGSHQPHRHHHKHSNPARIIRGVVFHIFIPILIGIVVGIAASLVGMIVGHLAIFLFRILFRSGRRSEYQRVEQDESKSFIEHQSPPPVYEDTPTYEEVVGTEKNL